MAQRTVLGFEALCNLYAPKACQCEVFSATYLLRKTSHGTRYFISLSGVGKIIVNMVDSDHGVRDSVIQVSGPWDAESDDERVAILVAWNLNAGSRGDLTLCRC